MNEEIRELEFHFEHEVKALDGIIFNNPSSVFFDVVLIKYQDNNTKKFTLTKWNATKNLRNLMRMFYKQNIFYKNLIKKENVYFAVTPKTKLLNFIWLDDIKLENINEKQLEYLTLIETSENNFQAFIKLDKLYTKNEIQQIKNYLINTLKADKGASSYIQPMRLPGFYSYKKETPFYVKVYKTAKKVLNGESLLKKIQPARAVGEKKSVINISQKNSDGSWKKYSWYKKQLNLENTEFKPEDERDTIINWVNANMNIAIDESIIDIMFVYQLLIRDYSENDIFLYLSRSRDDLFDKHKAADYFERTYLKALLFKKLFSKKFYDNRLLVDYIKVKKENGDWDESKKVTENLQILINNLKK